MVVLIKGVKMACIFMLCFWYSTSSVAQSSITSAITQHSITQSRSSNILDALEVGDIVPDIKFSVVNHPDSIIQLSDLRGKLVLLDFWATWCRACINRFPKLDSLQRYFDNKLQIILVNSVGNGDSPEEVAAFFTGKQKKYGYQFNLPSAVNDSIASILFPHRSIPHYVWITPDGKVKAITTSRQVNVENIQSFLDGDGINLTQKIDVNLAQPLFLNQNISINQLTYYSIFIKGVLEGVPSSFRIRRSNNVIRGIINTNTPILSMYFGVANRLIKNFNSKRMILEVRDSSLLMAGKSKANKVAWAKENFYTYELIVPISEANRLYSMYLEGLNQNSSYYGRVENRKVKCWKLVQLCDSEIINSNRIDKEIVSLFNSKNNSIFKSVPISKLIDYLNNLGIVGLPVVDGLHSIQNINIKLPEVIKDMITLEQWLKKYGLRLVEDETKLDMFVISDR